MKRQDQIKEMAKFHAKCMTSDKDMRVAFADALRRGAQWADEHPDIDVRTMAAWRSGYKEAIDKACEWLKMVYDAFVGLCDYLHNEGCIKDEWYKDFIDMANEKKEMTKCNLALHELANLLDEACDKLCLCADACGVEVKGGEE